MVNALLAASLALVAGQTTSYRDQIRVLAIVSSAPLSDSQSALFKEKFPARLTAKIAASRGLTLHDFRDRGIVVEVNDPWNLGQIQLYRDMLRGVLALPDVGFRWTRLSAINPRYRKGFVDHVYSHLANEVNGGIENLPVQFYPSLTITVERDGKAFTAIVPLTILPENPIDAEKLPRLGTKRTPTPYEISTLRNGKGT